MSIPTADEQRQVTPHSEIAPSAQNKAAPTARKSELIKRFLRAIGLQDKLDSGSFLERYAIPGGVMWSIDTGSQPTEDLRGGFDRRMSALIKAYEKHRSAYQQAYEDHVNWGFSEHELAEIVAFLESAVGQHYLDGRWRMEAYTNTNTEGLEEEIVNEAQASIAE